MSAFRDIDIAELPENPFALLGGEWMLVAAGDERGFNMMSASGGFFGELWDRHIAVTVVRPQRYTFEFLQRHEMFSLSFFGADKSVHKVCGHQSGRDVDKAAATGLIPVFSDGTVYFEQARLVLLCRKLYVQALEEACFVNPELCGRFYPECDYHVAFFGGIERALLAGQPPGARG